MRLNFCQFGNHYSGKNRRGFDPKSSLTTPHNKTCRSRDMARQTPGRPEGRRAPCSQKADGGVPGRKFASFAHVATQGLGTVSFSVCSNAKHILTSMRFHELLASKHNIAQHCKLQIGNCANIVHPWVGKVLFVLTTAHSKSFELNRQGHTATAQVFQEKTAFCT